HPAAGRQQRRRRHARADGVGAALPAKGRRCHRAVRHHQRRPVLRRCHDHACAVGALGDRGPQGRHACFRTLRGAADRAHFGAAIRVPIARNGQGGGILRPDHAGMVRHHCHRRTVARGAESRRAVGVQSGLWGGIPRKPRHDRACHLGAVFLVVTGSEALYADLGHFGRGPIQTAWLAVALPALTINYLGQGALVLTDPKSIENPFFLLYPDWALLPMVVVATAATVIASQAVITGAYSLTQQAIHLRLLPRLEIRHTSEALFGQIYMPRVNMLLLVGVLLLVALFRSSSALASAYGIAVTGTMVVTITMAFVVVWRVWHWPPLAAAALIVPFL